MFLSFLFLTKHKEITALLLLSLVAFEKGMGESCVI